MCQFGLAQHIPSHPSQPQFLHDLTLRGKNAENWVQLHQPFIHLWENRRNNIQDGNPQYGLLGANSDYMRWYIRHTRRWMTRYGAEKGLMGDSAERIYYYSTAEDGMTFTLDELRQEAEIILAQMDELDRIVEPVVEAPAPTQDTQTPEMNSNIPSSRVEGHGLQRRRRREIVQEHVIPPIPDRGHGQYYVPPMPSQNPTSSYPPVSYYYPSQDQTNFASSSHAACPSPNMAFDSSMLEFPSPSMAYASPTPAYYPPSSPFFTPACYIPSSFTPDAPIPFHNEPFYSSGTEGIDLNQGIDLNDDFTAVVTPLDDNADGVRRNPHRDARDRRRGCILTPDNPHYSRNE